MVIITDLGNGRFELDGIEHYKNYTPVTAGNNIKILNAYDSDLVLLNTTNYANVEVDTVTYGNIADLQAALLPVIFERDGLAIPGNPLITATKETFTATDLQTVFNLSSSPTNVDVFIDGQVLTETTDYTFSGSTVTLTEGADLNAKVTVRKY